jgi:hypothetical protein
MATASRRIVLVLGMSAFLIAMLVCWPGGSRSAWAQNDPAAPTTYNFRVDQLEVEAKQGDKPATLVTVRNGDDQDDDLEFTAEVQGGGGISDPESSTTAEDGSAEAQSTLSFLNEALDLALRVPSGEQPCSQLSSLDQGAKTAAATVFVKRSGGTQPLKLAFTSVARKATREEGITNPASVEVYVYYDEGCSQSADFPANADVQAYNLVFVAPFTPSSVPVWSSLKEFGEWFFRFSPPDNWRIVTGYLIVDSEDNPQTVPGMLTMQLASRPGGYGTVTFIIILGLAVVWGVFTYYVTRWLLGKRAKKRLGESADKIYIARRNQWLDEELAFEFKSGWASTLTTTGAILGTLLSAGVLPSDTVVLSKEQYISLNLLFALVLVLAAVWHNLTQNGRSFLLAYALTLGAGFGEMITALLVLHEIGFQGSMPKLIVYLIEGILIVAAIVATRAAYKSAIKKIVTPRAKGGLV